MKTFFANFSEGNAAVVATSNCYNNKTSELILITFASFQRELCALNCNIISQDSKKFQCDTYANVWYHNTWGDPQSILPGTATTTAASDSSGCTHTIATWMSASLPSSELVNQSTVPVQLAAWQNSLTCRHISPKQHRMQAYCPKTALYAGILPPKQHCMQAYCPKTALYAGILPPKQHCMQWGAPQ